MRRRKTRATRGTGNLYQEHGAWFIRLRVGAKRRAYRLEGSEKFISRLDAERAAEELKMKMRLAGTGRSWTLATFIKNWYLPVSLTTTRRSTHREYIGMATRYRLITAEIKRRGKTVRVPHRPEADLFLWEYRTKHIQALLTSVAEERKLSKASVQHLKHFLSGVFRNAAVSGMHDGQNPVTQAMLPSRLQPARETSVYTLQELNTVLAALTDAPKAAVALAGLAGLRLAEIQGLTWANYDGVTITISSTMWRGETNAPKTKASAAAVPVIPQLREILDDYKRPQAPGRYAKPRGTYPADAMFPIDLDHLGRRVLRPEFKRAGVEWKGWHAFRRGIASTLFQLGASDIDVQKVLRHSRVLVTRAHYIKVADERTNQAMDMLSRAIGQQKASSPKRRSVQRAEK